MLIGSCFRWENLDRDLAIELCVFRKVHLTHPARSELLKNAVMGNRL